MNACCLAQQGLRRTLTHHRGQHRNAVFGALARQASQLELTMLIEHKLVKQATGPMGTENATIKVSAFLGPKRAFRANLTNL